MPFDLSDLDAREITLLALEYVRASARWFEEAADQDRFGVEVSALLRDAAASSRSFHEELRERVRARFGDSFPQDESLLAERTKRPSWLVTQPQSDISPEEILEVAISEQEEHYHFFRQQQEEATEPWLRDLFSEMAQHARDLVVLLEEEREGILDRDGV